MYKVILSLKDRDEADCRGHGKYPALQEWPFLCKPIILPKDPKGAREGKGFMKQRMKIGLGLELGKRPELKFRRQGSIG